MSQVGPTGDSRGGGVFVLEVQGWLHLEVAAQNTCAGKGSEPRIIIVTLSVPGDGRPMKAQCTDRDVCGPSDVPGAQGAPTQQGGVVCHIPRTLFQAPP